MPIEGVAVTRRASRRPPRRSLARSALEALAVLASPGLFCLVLRLRGMAPVELPDPSMHTTYIVDPRDIFTRYASAFASTARLREAARVGFLVPARATYLLFGAVGGFFSFRYLLALVAVVPLYLLLSRLYGRWAGWVGVAVILSSPVFVTAWGTDYPDSAALSYLTGGLCALVMPAPPRRRPGWVGLAAALFTLAVWSHGAAVPLVAVVMVAYLALRLARERPHLARDAGVAVATAAVVTGGLALGSWWLIGQWNYLTPTWQAARYLSTPAQVALWHSANWRWVLYDPYLLVPLATLGAFALVVGRRGRRLGTPEAFTGLSALLAFGVAAGLQFLGTVQMLETPLFSSLLWSFVAVLLALTLAALAAPFVTRVGARVGRQALPGLLLVGVALAYEADPHVPAMKLTPWAWVVAGCAVAAAGVWLGGSKLGAWSSRRGRAGLLSAAPLALFVVLSGALLILTVAPEVPHPPLPDTAGSIQRPGYATALGGSDASLVDRYQVTAELPGFVGHPTYDGEQLLMWWPKKETRRLLEPLGIFHAGFNLVGGTFPQLDRGGVGKIEHRRPGQILLMSVTGDGFSRAVRSLTPFQPVVVRRGILADGTYHIYVWLVDLRQYLPRVSSASTF
jgi:hypothetical protein